MGLLIQYQNFTVPTTTPLIGKKILRFSNIKNCRLFLKMQNNMYAKQNQNSCKLTWRPVKETNNLKMSLVPSNILKILRSRMTRSAPQSWKTSNEENSWLECSRKFQRPAVLLQYTVTLKIIKRNITHLHVTHSPKNLNALICHEPCCFLERERIFLITRLQVH